MAAMEATVIATAMPTVVADLGGLELYGWVGSVYLLGSTVTMPLYGKLSDLYGRRALVLVGIALFLLGSFASGLSQTMIQLIVFRGLQSLGAGGLQTLAFTITADLYTAEQRARMQGLFGAVWALAGMSGPFLGGVIVKYLSWRWVFFVNVPIGLLAAALYGAFFFEKLERRRVRLDLAGAASLSTAVVAVLLAASRVVPVVTIPLGVAAIAAFIRAEKRAEEPVLPLELMRQRTIATGSVLGAAVGGTMMATVTYLPLYVQGVLGETPTAAGATLAPMLLGWPLAAVIAGRILARVAFRPPIVGGWLLVTVAMAYAAYDIHRGANLTALRAAMFATGAGLGFVNTPLILAVQESVGWKERGTATATSTFFRTIGAAIAVGALGAVLASLLVGVIDPRTLSALMLPDHGGALPAGALTQNAAALGRALATVFALVAALSGVALAVSFSFPNARLGRAPEVDDPAGATPR